MGSLAHVVDWAVRREEALLQGLLATCIEISQHLFRLPLVHDDVAPGRLGHVLHGHLLEDLVEGLRWLDHLDGRLRGVQRRTLAHVVGLIGREDGVVLMRGGLLDREGKDPVIDSCVHISVHHAVIYDWLNVNIAWSAELLLKLLKSLLHLLPLHLVAHLLRH